MLFAFLYPKGPPDTRGESFEVLAAVAEAFGEYEVLAGGSLQRTIGVRSLGPFFTFFS
jgi:hypothetical protein